VWLGFGLRTSVTYHLDIADGSDASHKHIDSHYGRTICCVKINLSLVPWALKERVGRCMAMRLSDLHHPTVWGSIGSVTELGISPSIFRHERRRWTPNFSSLVYVCEMLGVLLQQLIIYLTKILDLTLLISSIKRLLKVLYNYIVLYEFLTTLN
jgi:hypothetical protein